MTFDNSKGQIYYGMHFYPGVAEYQDPGKDPYRVFLNEDTIRAMDPSFAGRPVFVMHVDGVDSNIDVLKTEADGWVVESFYNQADGKHWAKFIVCSEKGLRAVKNGMRLSNCYEPKGFAQGGLWNGVSYAKEITGGEYEHLAIVPNPRYEESVIMTPAEFKKYNDDKMIELKRLSNDKKGLKMALKFFKKAKVDNTVDLEEMSVVLPKTGREVTISQLVNELDRVRNDPPNLDPGGVASIKKAFGNEDTPSQPPKLDPKGVEAMKKAFGNEGLADPAHKVKLHDGSYCNVAELVEKHKAMHDELESMKKDALDKEKPDSPDEDGDPSHGEVDMESKDKMNKEDKKEGDEKEEKKHENEEDDDKDAKKKAMALADHEEKEIEEAKKKANAKEKAERLRNANLNVSEEVQKVDLPEDKVARGVQRYGSAK